MNQEQLLIYQSQFSALLIKEDRGECIRYALDGLESSLFTIPELYENIIAPSLAEAEACTLGDEGCIWHEHVRSGIVRTVIECCWPKVNEAGARLSQRLGRVLLFCPERELHELGIRMVTDFFTLNGWKADFVGANTPRKQIQAAVIVEKPDIIALSVTDYYHLVETEKVVTLIRGWLRDHQLHHTRVFAGGHAFRQNPEAAVKIGADGLLKSYGDIASLSREYAENRYSTASTTPAAGGGV